MRSDLLLAALAVALVGAAPSKEDVAKELKQLDGIWIIVGVHVQGNDRSESIADQDRFVFSGTRLSMYTGGREGKFTATIDPSAKPKTLDMSFDQDGQKSILPAVYEIAGDSMRLCYAFPDEPRPSGFTTRPEWKAFAFTLRRVQPGEMEKLTAATENGRKLLDQSKPAEAAAELETALGLARKIYGEKSYKAAPRMGLLARAYQEQGQYVKAEPLYEEALPVFAAGLGPDNEIVGITCDRLATVCQAVGHYARAEELFQRSIAISEKQFGADNPDLAKSLNNLAAFYQTTGQYAPAEELSLRSLKIFEDRYGADDPRTAMIMSNLGVLYRNMGQFRRAETLLARALAIYEDYQKDELMIAKILNNQGVLYENLGQYLKAINFFSRSLKILIAKLGKNHPDVANCLHNLAQIQIDLLEYDTAETNLRDAIEIYDVAYGPDNYFTARSIHNLSMVVARRGDLKRRSNWRRRRRRFSRSGWILTPLKSAIP